MAEHLLAEAQTIILKSGATKNNMGFPKCPMPYQPQLVAIQVTDGCWFRDFGHKGN